ncbi:hypothetical protein LCGC14_0413220 [marine sediment metagenome]|uniref:Uncharacterized protein n=1 Tax=marine sediment metagenome TaxID=412755 RepID=A0A0F9ST60_9ZZZZ
MSEQTISDRDKDEDEDEDGIFRLFDMLVEEVSLVDRPANKRRFLVVKRRDEMAQANAGTEVVVDETGELTAKPDDGGDGAGDGVGDGEGGGDATAAAIVAVEEAISKALTIPKPVKAAVLRLATEALERQLSLVDTIKSAKETDEQIDKPLPAQVSREIGAIVKLLQGIGERYPSPVAGAAAAKSDDETDAVALDDLVSALNSITEKVTPIDKRGRKMAKEKLKRFRAALKALDELLKELDPEAAGIVAEPAKGLHDGKDKGKTKKDDKPAEPIAKSSPDVEKLVTSVTELTEVVKQQSTELTALKKAHGLPSALTVDGGGGPPPKEASWPADMNNPINRDTVKKEHWFGE